VKATCRCIAHAIAQHEGKTITLRDINHHCAAIRGKPVRGQAVGASARWCMALWHRSISPPMPPAVEAAASIHGDRGRD
jgi:hypothetical protein